MKLTWHNDWHYGDCLLHLLLLRRLKGIKHVFHVRKGYIYELRNYSPGIPLRLIEQRPPGSINSWLGQENGRFFWGSPHKEDYARCMLDLYAHLADKAGVRNPVATKDALFLDWPEMQEPCALSGKVDVLLVNSLGGSNQTEATPDEWQPIADDLKKEGLRVATTSRLQGHPCTMDYGMNLAQIGSTSIGAKVIAGVQTGPFHPTFNVWTRDSGARWINLHKKTCFKACKRVRWVKRFENMEKAIFEEIEKQ